MTKILLQNRRKIKRGKIEERRRSYKKHQKITVRTNSIRQVKIQSIKMFLPSLKTRKEKRKRKRKTFKRSTKKKFLNLSFQLLNLYPDLWSREMAILKIMRWMKMKHWLTWARLKHTSAKFLSLKINLDMKLTEKKANPNFRFMILQSSLLERRKEDLLSPKKLRCLFVIWEMVAGLFIILHPRFKLDNTEVLRQLLEFHIALQLTFGALPAWFLKWSLETFFSNQDLGQAIVKMTIILLKWLSCLVLFQSILPLVENFLKSSLIIKET